MFTYRFFHLWKGSRKFKPISASDQKLTHETTKDFIYGFAATIIYLVL